MADTGDGWQATYTMAYLLTNSTLTVSRCSLKRAQIVILGGDEVYPVASGKMYSDRLSYPFDEAAHDIEKQINPQCLHRKDIFLIPGNHDWYDSLGSFTKRFLAVKEPNGKRCRNLGNFRVQQLRSYFVLTLPNNWEIWAVDVQLGHNIDNDQYTFFKERAKCVTCNTKIVLCSAEPTIVNGNRKPDGVLDEDNRVFGLQRIRMLARERGARVMVELAGDTHNYQHYKICKTDNKCDPYTRHHIVSGGGGAFLHPNHAFPKNRTVDGESYTAHVGKRYPDETQSRRLSWRILGFSFFHKKMDLMIGALYVLMYWGGDCAFWKPDFVIQHPFSSLLIAGTVLGCGFFGRSGCSSRYRWDGVKSWTVGLIHGGTQIFASFSELEFRQMTSEYLLSLAGSENWICYLEVFLPRVATVVIGGIFGGTLLGVYLWGTLTFLKMHSNEAFAALAYPDYKHFLRCRLKGKELEINVVGVEKIARQRDGHPVDVHLVEHFTVS